MGSLSYINKKSLFTASLTLKDVIDYTDKSTLAKLEDNYIVSKELYDRTVEIIRENFDLLEAIANELLEKETIYADEIDRIVGDKIGAYTAP